MMHIPEDDGVLVLSTVSTMNTMQMVPTVFLVDITGVLTMPVVF
jgi:hypothetical protein